MNTSLKQKLQEELRRYNSINKYVNRLLEQQDQQNNVAPPPPLADAGSANASDPAAQAAAAPPTDATAAPAAPTDAAAPPPAPGGEQMGGTPDTGGMDTSMNMNDPSMNDTQGIDVTELVNMTKDVQSKLDKESQKSDENIHKMDTVFSKLDDLESKLSELNNIAAKIDSLEVRVKEMKPLTPEERLNLRSLDSYPFSQKVSDFWRDKEPEMKMTGKNQYVLKSDDINNYNKSDITNSFD